MSKARVWKVGNTLVITITKVEIDTHNIKHGDILDIDIKGVAKRNEKTLEPEGFFLNENKEKIEEGVYPVKNNRLILK